MNKHLRMNRITQNEEEIHLLKSEWAIKGWDDWVSKDKALGGKRNVISLGSALLLLFFLTNVLFIHISGLLFLNVPKKILNWKCFYTSTRKSTSNLLKIVSNLTNIT